MSISARWSIGPFRMVIALCAWFSSIGSTAQVLITSPAFVYNQSFNTLATTGPANVWSNNSTIPGWYALSQAGGHYNTYIASDGSLSNHGIHSFGNSADRALGSINQYASGDIVFGVLFQNNSATTLRSVTVSFTAEQWRSAQTSTRGFQRMKVSYRVGNSINTSVNSLIDEGNFTEVPEAYLITPDSTSIDPDLALDGNLVENSAHIAVTFPVNIGAGSKFFLRFYDENVPGLDHALAVDDLQVSFSTLAVARIAATSDYPIGTYLNQGIIKDIPESTSGYTYITPLAADLGLWSVMLQNFYTGNLDGVDLSSYGYVATEFTESQSGEAYFILRKTNGSGYYWGTYLIRVTPNPRRLVLQAPHPKIDTYSGDQAAALMELTRGDAFMVAGISRCTSNSFTSCVGTTAVCGQSESYRASDVAHTENSIFHMATTLLADLELSTIFVQLHGFSMDPGDPNFIISCGTLNAHLKSVPDFGVIVRENLLNANPLWSVKIAHVDDYDILAGTVNVQGRYLNEYPYDNCLTNVKPPTVTNRFLHIEQYMEARKFSSNYDDIAAAINAVIQLPYQKAISVDAITDVYTQNFNTLTSGSTQHTWGNNLHVPAWYAVKEEVGLFSIYTNDDGSDDLGGLYAYGSVGQSDRAIGLLTNDLETGNAAFGVLLENNSGGPIQSVILSYRGEQWRRSTGTTSELKLSYRISNEIDLTPDGLLNNTLFTGVPSGNVVSMDDNSAEGPLDGNTNFVMKDEVVFSDAWNEGQQLFIRFYSENDMSGKGLAVDDFEVSFSSLILPVKWLYFEIHEAAGSPHLTWGTADEEECDRFEVLRSDDAFTYTVIETLPCQGGATNSYDFIDSAVLKSDYLFYRIRQYDYDGMSTDSKVAVWDNRRKWKPTIYVDELGRLKIVANEDISMNGISVFDMLGREVHVLSVDADNTVSLASRPLPGSILIVRVVITSGVFTVRLIIPPY